MKIVIASHGIHPDSIGGMERHTYNLAKALKDEGVDVHVIVPAPAKGTSFPFSVHYLPWPQHLPWLIGNYIFSRCAGRWIEKEKPDIAFGQGFALWAYLRQRRIPVIYHPHGLEMFGDGQSFIENFRSLLFQSLVRYHVKNSDAVISLGGMLTTILTNRVDVSKLKIHTIPNAINIGSIVTKDRKENSFLFVGRLAFNKGIDRIVDALHQLKDRELSLTIVGDGPLRPIAEDLANRDPRVTLKGRLSDPDLQREYDSHECLLFASRFEGMPTVILEAMAHGCTAIATDIGTVATMVTPETGLLVDSGGATIARAIESYLALDKDKKNLMSLAARRRVEEQFTWSTVTKSYLELFSNLLEQDAHGK